MQHDRRHVTATGARVMPPRLLLVIATLPSGNSLTRELESQSDFRFQRECNGYDEEWGKCEYLGDCGSLCVPQDCKFGEWQDWHSSGGCTGLRYRRRDVSVTNNECGLPCNGATVESERETVINCEALADCDFSAWSSWSACNSSLDQRIRHRGIMDPASPDGMPCHGPLNETMACSMEDAPQSCRWSLWGSWGRCSVSCGQGRHERMRRVDRRSDPGGIPCWGSSLENGVCNNGACQPTDCRLGPWSQWSECEAVNAQRYRRRRVDIPPSNGGRECDEFTMETVACFAPSSEGEDCEIGLWTQWSECSKTCGGGQMYRKRHLEKPNSKGGYCHHAVLSQAEPCGMNDCSATQPNDCQFEHWGSWSNCDAPCGKGTRERTRQISVYAVGNGRGCEGATQELSGCLLQECEVVDCRWSDWYEWSVCSASCNGGTKRRERNVAVAPQNGGSLCLANEKSEMVPCNTLSCDEACLDGEWADWSSWTVCSATCGVAYKSRRRDVAVQPSHCGKPAVGLREEYKTCVNLEPCNMDQNCLLGQWNSWSECSCSCFGIRERNRVIEQFASGNGLSCNGTVKEVVPCNPGPHEERDPQCGNNKRITNCVLAEWDEWAECSATCGGGQKQRSRAILQEAAFGGEPCSDFLAEIEPCSEESCPEAGCHDCKWSEWTHWGSCSKCGGQRFRYRNIVQMPNYCGTPCEPMDAREAGPCQSKCDEELYCSWTEWSKSESCNKCGVATSTRNRALGIMPFPSGSFFMVADQSQCAGTQLNVSECPEMEFCEPCQPQNCTFADWSDWHAPTCLGLCERHRVIEKHNNDCGSGCEGAILDTKVCPVTCGEPQDCELSQWSDWEGCDRRLQGALRLQMDRKRTMKKMPMNGGQPCSGDLVQTYPCPKIPVDCVLTPWNSWSTCSTRCVTGWHTRKREVERQAVHGGEGCAGPLWEIDLCLGSNPECRQSGKEDCKWSPWDQWSHCGYNGQMTRKRRIVELPSVFGEACHGSLHETAWCDSQRVDCDVSPWSEWDACDRSCDGGQSHRHREVHRYPSGGGSPCPTILMQTQGCNSQSCSGFDCIFSDWSAWGVCSTTCGVGQVTRSRRVVTERGPDGHGCYDSLGEVKECHHAEECAARDCVWGEWTQWSYCSRSCAGGMRTRRRHVLTVPNKHGRPCDAEIKESVQPCNTQKCSDSCADGVWEEWSDWAPCSVSCARGTTFRRRAVKSEATHCGEIPAGKSLETRFCEVNVPCVPELDCQWEPWSLWGECSADCDGTQARTRDVKNYGMGHGRWCKGAMKEIRPCHPHLDQHRPIACRVDEPVDCELGEWTPWSRCTSPCDGGVQRRTRVVARRASHGGKGCIAALSEVHECNRHLCGGGGIMPQDCEVGQWEDWGICNKCDGETTRFRNILRHAAHGGRPCDPVLIREVKECPRHCDSNLFCTWASWEDWAACSKTCGRGGKRRRRRYLHLTNDRHDVLSPEPEREVPSTTTTEPPPPPPRMPQPSATLPPPTLPPPVAAPVVAAPLGGGMSVTSVHGLNAVTAAYAKLRSKDEMQHWDLVLAFLGGFVSLSLASLAWRRQAVPRIDDAAEGWTA